jgi:hypothetical protein
VVTTAAAWVKAQAARFRRKPAVSIGQPLRFGRAALAAALPVALVALVAGKVSYSHITALGMRTQQGYTDSHLLFLPIDGLIVAGTVLLLYGSLLGWLGVALGVAATLFANLQFGLPHGTLPAVVSTWPAIAFSVACFMLERWLRSRRQAPPSGAVSSPVAGDAENAAAASLRATLAAGNGWSQNQLQERFGLTRAQATEVRKRVLAGSNGHELNGAAK